MSCIPLLQLHPPSCGEGGEGPILRSGGFLWQPFVGHQQPPVQPPSGGSGQEETDRGSVCQVQGQGWEEESGAGGPQAGHPLNLRRILRDSQ